MLHKHFSRKRSGHALKNSLCNNLHLSWESCNTMHIQRSEFRFHLFNIMSLNLQQHKQDRYNLFFKASLGVESPKVNAPISCINHDRSPENSLPCKRLRQHGSQGSGEAPMSMLP